jgi:hypothetical protein
MKMSEHTEKGAQQSVHYELIRPDQPITYDLQYSEDTSDEIGRLSGFSVLIETSPTD